MAKSDDTTISSGDSSEELLLGVGNELGRYRLLEELGKGGMGVVFRAHDPELDRHVALKLVRPRGIDPTAERQMRARLVREAQAMATVSHPNVVEVFDVGVLANVVFIAMELVPGRTLSAWLREDRTVDEILEVFRQAGTGLAAAHSAGLVHRDFKPANAMVSDSGRVRVLDFGLAVAPGTLSSSDLGVQPSSWSGSGSGRLTETGVLMGTPRYMAPEQHAGRPADERADQFAFCVALYRALSGAAPFVGDSLEELAHEKSRGHIRPPRSDRRIPKSILEALRRGMAAEPDDRFPTMHELLAALEPAKGRRGLIALGVVALGAAAAVSTTSESERGCDDEIQTVSTALAGPREVLREAFANSGRSYTSDAQRRVEQQLDAYQQQWTRAARAVCLQGAEVELRVLEVRTACLRRDLSQVQALVEAFGTGDPQALSRGVRALSNLPEADRCVRLDPDDDLYVRSGVAQEDRVRFTDAASRSAASYKAGDYDTAKAEAKIAITIARQANAELLEAKGRFHLAQALLKGGHGKDARAEYEAAFFVAREHGDDDLAELTAVKLLYIDASILYRFEDAKQWARYAESHLDRLGRPRGREAQLLSHLATLYSRTEQEKKALATYREALAIFEAQGADYNAGRTLNQIAHKLMIAGEYDESEKVFLRSLETFERALGPDHPDLINILSNLGEFYEQTGQNDKGLQTLTRAVAVAEPGHPEKAKALVKLGDVHRQLRNLGESRKLYDQALEIFVEKLGPEHATVGAVYRHYAAVEMLDENLAEAVRYNRKALTILVAAEGPRTRSVGLAYGNLAALMAAQDQHEGALPYYAQAEEIFRGTFGEEHPAVGAVLTDAAMSLVELQRYDEAIEKLEAAMLLPDVRMEGPTSRAMTRFVLAKALWASGGDRQRALTLAREAETDFERRGPVVEEKLGLVRAWLSKHDR